MSIADILNFIENVAFDQLPPDIVAMAKVPILDCLGVAVAGCRDEGSRIIRRYAAEDGGKPEAGVIGGEFRTTTAQAAWVNGTTAHILDYDDYYLPYHPTVAILPAILATAEKYHLSGKEVLLAYVTGFEVQASIAVVMGRRHYEHGWHSTPWLGSLGAAVAVAKMLKLNQEKTGIAIGIAGSLAGGLRRNFGSMTKSLHAGNAAKNGVIAATLAQNGFTADSHILEDNQGFLEVLGMEKERSAPDMGKELGTSYYLASPGISIKPYPSCAGTHWAIDAILEPGKTTDIDYQDISEIECRTPTEVPQILIHSRPRTALEGKFSLEYCIAAAFIYGEVRLKQFTDDRLQAPAVRDLIRRIKYVHPPEMGTRINDSPCEMVIKLRDGRACICREKKPKGTSDNPLTQAELEQKFRDCVAGCLSPAVAASVLEQIASLESVEDITGLMNTFTFFE